MNGLLLASINWSTFGLVVGIVAGIAIVFGILITVVSKLCAVNEDERISKVQEHLAGANCGGCGYAGCGDYAKALVEGKATLSDCNATDGDSKSEIASILGIEFGGSEPMIAVIKCAGGDNAPDKYKYLGVEGCVMQAGLVGGRKVCSDGCLGNGDCAVACQYNGITFDGGVGSIDKSLCEGCGACARACPKHLIELIPKRAKVYVACSTKCVGKVAMSNCKVSCIGCGLCAKNCTEGAIVMANGLPVIDYNKCTGCLTCVSKCPRKSIKEI